MPAAFVRAAIVSIFFVSGAAGLIYEVLWTRQLGLVFGVTTYAVATVLSTYMGGLALGSYVVGRRADRLRSPLVAYALLEAGIGLYALLVPMLFEALRLPYIVLRQLDVSHAVLICGRAVLAAGVLMIPTTLMGGTFPVLTRFWVRARAEVGWGVGLLYFVNTAGAITGCLLAGFYLIEHFGLAWTTRIAALTSLTVGGVALLLARTWGAEALPESVAAAGEAGAEVRSRVAELVLVCIGVSGFASLGYEVLWTRALLRYVYNSTYAFTTMLATFLAGIAIGSALYTVVLRRSRRSSAVFAGLQILTGLGFAVSALLFTHLTDASAAILGGEVVQSFQGAVAAMFLRAALILLAPTVFLGATLPLATAICVRNLAHLGRAVGRVYAVNTLGAILGSLAAGFVFIPAIGMHGTLLLLIAINIASAAAVVLVDAQRWPWRLGSGIAAVAALAAVLWSVPDDLFMRTLPLPGQSVVFYREGATDTVAVIEVRGQRVIMYDDRRGTAGTLSYGWNYFLGHLPMLLHPGAPRRVLHICFGVGNSLSAVAAHEALERVDNVELSPHVVEAAPYFWTNSDVIHYPKVRTIIDDGRNFIMASDETYDVILLEPPETFTAGVINLYTREFYWDALARLAPDGIMMQWIPAGESPLDDERRLFRAFADVFPHVTAWKLLDSGCILLIGTRQPLTVDYLRLVQRLQAPKIRRDMELSDVRDVDHFLSFFVFDEAAFRTFVRDVPPVTDDRTVLDFAMPRYLGSGFGLGSFNTSAQEDGRNPFFIAMQRSRYYFEHRRSVVPYLTNLGSDSPAAIAARIAARAKEKIRHSWIPEAEWRRW